MGIETTASKLSKILETKAAIKQSITNKGVSIPEGTVFGDYPTLIDSIEVGSGGSGSDYENPDFYEIRTNGGTDYVGLFYYYQGKTLDLSNWDTSNVTNMKYMFYYCTKLTSLDLSNFDTSNVTDMQYMFYYCRNLTTLDLSNWDTSNVTDMSDIFNGCTNLTTLDLSNWDTSNVTNMYRIFYGCEKLTTLDLSNFDTSNVTDMGYMFSWCTKLTTITGEIDASGVKNGLYPSSYVNPFKSISLETLYLKNIYKNCTMTNASKWSINLTDTKVKDECLIYIINELPDLINDKGLTSTRDIVFTLPPTNTLTQEQVQVAIDKGWSVANTNYS